jgi:hypothetical protein
LKVIKGENMKTSVQYNTLTGDISAVVQTSKPPKDEDFPKNRAQILIDGPVDCDGKRVNLKTLELEDCPVIAKTRHNNALLSQIRHLEETRQARAVREKELTGSLDALQKLEDDINVLRLQMIKD